VAGKDWEDSGGGGLRHISYLQGDKMELKDWLTVVATLLSPLIALQVSELIARRRQKREEQIQIFKTLMATRASSLDQRHVESLNMIDVIFSANTRTEKQIRHLWKQYLDHLGDKTYSRESWRNRQLELQVDLLHAIAIHLGFDFDKTHIKNQCYHPEGYGHLEDDQQQIRKSLKAILSAEKPIRMWVDNLPNPEPTSKTQ
jgi:hypothetical protein